MSKTDEETPTRKPALLDLLQDRSFAHGGSLQNRIGTTSRNIARQGHHRGRAEEADVDPRGRETRGGGSDREVAARDELAPGRSRHPLNGGNDRLRQADDPLHDVAATLPSNKRRHPYPKKQKHI